MSSRAGLLTLYREDKLTVEGKNNYYWAEWYIQHTAPFRLDFLRKEREGERKTTSLRKINFNVSLPLIARSLPFPSLSLPFGSWVPVNRTSSSFPFFLLLLPLLTSKFPPICPPGQKKGKEGGEERRRLGCFRVQVAVSAEATESAGARHAWNGRMVKEIIEIYLILLWIVTRILRIKVQNVACRISWVT